MTSFCSPLFSCMHLCFTGSHCKSSWHISIYVFQVHECPPAVPSGKDLLHEDNNLLQPPNYVLICCSVGISENHYKVGFYFFLAMNLPIIFSINRLVCKISKRVTNGKLFLVIFQNPRWCLLFSSPNIKQRKAANPLIWSWNQKKLGMFSWKNIETIKWWSKQ